MTKTLSSFRGVECCSKIAENTEILSSFRIKNKKRERVSSSGYIYHYKYLERLVFGIFRCTTCEQIKHFISLKVNQKMDDLLEQMCIHSRAANYFRGSDWEQFWPCGLRPSDETYNIQCNIETDFVRLEQIVSSCSPA